MIKKPALILLLLLWAIPVAARPLVVTVQSFNVRPYEEAVKGFESVSRAAIHKINLSEIKGPDMLDRIREKNPDLVVAVGMGALSAAWEVKNIPLVYMMAADSFPDSLSAGRATGVSMNVSPDVQMDIFAKALPDIKTIGVLYNPEKTGFLVREALLYLRGKPIRLVAETIKSPQDISRKLDRIKSDIDAFWMLPDVTLAAPEALEILLLFSLENRIPILTFSEKYVEIGALMSIGTDPFDMGIQAGEMAEKILSGADPKTVLPEYARKTVITINETIGKKLGIRLGGDILKQANLIK
jgi:putative tryptophan/tyrosine transport system substrate-binding protein